ncbi:unnamed protein product [Rotaria sordida]|uniref:Uncharacterized protein n=1 Tax=Rotaria sordida TaxID=392033 RepID=A0A814X0W8_9BILA|nr:unnamed protein product [Rotaria sordida]CAF1205215.1 unnamed protein product [Rotaria sordida]CAF1479929.1 unnamed protein product [Rotaria sordida]
MKIFICCFLLAMVLKLSNEKYICSKNEILSISNGVSFGFCLKYCRQSITIRAGSNRLVALKEPNFPQNAYPPVKRIYRFSRKKWNELINLINDKSFQSLNDTEGCPDCADGGAEWIEIQWTNQKKRVTFENGKLIKGFEGLVIALRNIRVNTTQNL